MLFKSILPLDSKSGIILVVQPINLEIWVFNAFSYGRSSLNEIPGGAALPAGGTFALCSSLRSMNTEFSFGARR